MPYRTVFLTARRPPLPGRIARVIVGPLALLILSAAPTRATTVESLDFSELHRRAATVVRAKCVDRKEITDDGPVPYTRYTVEVVEAIKGCRDARGAALGRLTFRHGGTRSGYRRSDGLYVPPLRLGIPEYEPGDELVLFLTAESSLGLCAPVGLGQGAFRILRVAGKERVANAFRNRGLFPERATVASQEKSPEARAPLDQASSLELQDFLERCRQAQSEIDEDDEASPPAEATSPKTESKPRVVNRSPSPETEEPQPASGTGKPSSPGIQVERSSSGEVTR